VAPSPEGIQPHQTKLLVPKPPCSLRRSEAERESAEILPCRSVPPAQPSCQCAGEAWGSQRDRLRPAIPWTRAGHRLFPRGLEKLIMGCSNPQRCRLGESPGLWLNIPTPCFSAWAESAPTRRDHIFECHRRQRPLSHSKGKPL